MASKRPCRRLHKQLQHAVTYRKHSPAAVVTFAEIARPPFMRFLLKPPRNCKEFRPWSRRGATQRKADKIERWRRAAEVLVARRADSRAARPTRTIVIVASAVIAAALVVLGVPANGFHQLMMGTQGPQAPGEPLLPMHRFIPVPRREASASNPFAQIIARKLPAVILFEDDELIVIRDRSPAAPLHLQVIPKLAPVPRDVQALTDDHAPLVRRMQSVAITQLQKEGFSEADSRIGFHVPPFISVPHLHMHVISPAADIITRKRFKYVPGSFWFWTSARVLEKLESDSCLQRLWPW